MRKIFYVLICLLFFTVNVFSASVIVNPKFLALVDGEPLASGLVYTYLCGTTTPKTTYTTYAGSTANANPVVLSAQGEASIYAKGCLKIVVKTSAGATVTDGTIDNIYSFDNSVIQDTDRDTIIQCEESSDEDVIRFDVGGSQKMYIDSNGVHIGTTVTNSETLGRAERSKFRWKDADEIYIGAGAYHHSGTSEQFLYWNSELTFHLESTGTNALSNDLSTGEWHYIYIDDSAVITQASALLDNDCFINSTTAPAYSSTKHGWYPATTTNNVTTSDRCVFAVWSDGSAEILEFFHDGGDFITYATNRTPLGWDDTKTGTYADLDMADYMPVFSTRASIQMLLEVKTSDAAVYAYWRTNGQTDTTGQILGGLERIGTDQIAAFAGTNVITDSSQVIEIKLSRDGADLILINIIGWYFPQGM